MQTLTLMNTLAQIALLAMQSMSEADRQKTMAKLFEVLADLQHFGDKMESAIGRVSDKLHHRDNDTDPAAALPPQELASA